jgi:hypothetical protein
MNADPAAPGRLTNAFVIFDYHGPNDFNFAGGYVGSDQWLIGHRTNREWVLDAAVNAPIEVYTDYALRVRVTNDTQVTLSVDDIVVVTHTYGDSLSDGDAGVGTRNAVSRFDNISARAIVAPQVQLFSGRPLEQLLESHWLRRLAPFYDEGMSGEDVGPMSRTCEVPPADLPQSRRGLLEEGDSAGIAAAVARAASRPAKRTLAGRAAAPISHHDSMPVGTCVSMGHSGAAVRNVSQQVRALDHLVALAEDWTLSDDLQDAIEQLTVARTRRR